MFLVIPGIYADAKGVITIEVDYNNIIPSETVDVPCEEGMSVMEALQKIAVVETHPLGGFVVVIAIDGIRGERGKMAWYYSINGKTVNKMAFSNIIDKDVKRIKWIYKKDECSKKVDGDIY